MGRTRSRRCASNGRHGSYPPKGNSMNAAIDLSAIKTRRQTLEIVITGS